MASDDRSTNLALVEPFLRDVGKYQLEGFRILQAADIQVKTGGSYGKTVVTEYDVESERRVARFLEERFPSDSFLGEESGNVRRDPARYWVLDPIDGTTNFTQGTAYWGPTLALFRNNILEAGWIYFPVLDQMFSAVRGGGAYLDGKRIRSSSVKEYSDLATVGTTSRFHRRYQLTVPAKHRILGSLIANLAYLASGTFAASYCRAHIWDVAAGILIAREAGAVIDCRPDLATMELAAVETDRAPSLTIYGRANEDLPSLEGYVIPIEERRPSA